MHKQRWFWRRISRIKVFLSSPSMMRRRRRRLWLLLLFCRIISLSPVTRRNEGARRKRGCPIITYFAGFYSSDMPLFPSFPKQEKVHYDLFLSIYFARAPPVKLCCRLRRRQGGGSGSSGSGCRFALITEEREGE